MADQIILYPVKEEDLDYESQLFDPETQAKAHQEQQPINTTQASQQDQQQNVVSKTEEEKTIPELSEEVLDLHRRYAKLMYDLKNDKGDGYRLPVYQSQKQFEELVIDKLNSYGKKRGLKNSIMKYNGFVNSFSTVSCMYCHKYKLQYTFEKDNEGNPFNIQFNRMLHGNNHDWTVNHY